jgi:two-component sensor histidine kinase
VFPGLDIDRFAAIAHVAQTGEPLRWQGLFAPTGRFYENVYYSPHPGQLAGIFTDITERKQAEEALKASLHEKEVLLKEIHHRVKNNMQVISSLVSLQAEQLRDSALRDVFQEVSDRVRSMALVHEKLYQSADLARVEFAEYAQSLLNYLWRAHGTAACGIRLAVDLEPVPLSVNVAVPCGLILNELATNALKHAFRGRDGGTVKVSLRGSPDGRVCLRVGDNGTGLPPGLDWRQADSLGLRLVQILAKQLDATVEVARVEGTEFAVTFPMT